MYNNNNQAGDRQMYKGTWTCSQCGAEITELPFEPDGNRPLYCRDCHRQQRQSRPRRF
ncbi:MAG: CxxC-x17-CxxC domain-containing protein [Candidatus Falkowbacteria bacterium]